MNDACLLLSTLFKPTHKVWIGEPYDTDTGGIGKTIRTVGDQIRFWTSVKLPIVALIDSGGKSIHAWIDVQKLFPVSTKEEWETKIKNSLYDRILTPLGVDGACSNPARLSRLPGREGKGNYIRLL